MWQKLESIYKAINRRYAACKISLRRTTFLFLMILPITPPPTGTIEALAETYPKRRIIVAFEPRSNSMKAGVFNKALATAFTGAARVIAYSGVSLGPWLMF